jgi:Zn-finger nucleic acid-binding protein
MSIACPRCNVSLSPRTAAPTPGEAAVTADLCARCQGIWLDGAELARVSPALGGLPLRTGEIAAIAVPSGIACPRCRSALAQLTLHDVPIDFCAGCYGVWLDGNEYEALSRAADRGEGLPAPEGGADRAETVKRVQNKSARCSTCQVEAPIDKTYLTDVGLVCAACWLSKEQGAMRERSEKGDEEFARKVRASSGGPRPTAGHATATADEIAGGIVLGIIEGLLAGPRCSRCGCRHGSHCDQLR